MRKNYNTIQVEEYDRVAFLNLNRPTVRNAINNQLVDDLHEVFDMIAKHDSIRCVVMTGNGEAFCAGADLKWLGEVAHYSYTQNYEESLKLADLMYKIHEFPKPVIARVNGHAVGGGVGFMLASDIVIADEKAKFGLSEVSIGIIPAAIAPFVMNRIGETKAREYFLTGERIDAKEAKAIGLINYAVPADKLDELVNEKIKIILQNGPKAMLKVKEMMSRIPHLDNEETKTFIAETIAKLRTSTEGQEGIAAFLEKREPAWRKK
jgi:methylglutaconyl-CoA hydratase